MRTVNISIAILNATANGRIVRRRIKQDESASASNGCIPMWHARAEVELQVLVVDRNAIIGARMDLSAGNKGVPSDMGRIAEND
jgi:hypothetical protein